ncbi:glutamate synthase subunit beta [Rhizosphaericola mali]|uniref:Glutamate synthase subunit beta n=1 Tax=Rhizosphaericola mali TaxID=2545455 RepID=A0A5P2G2G1_9BACT|nr:glutamate synthase subunit beta [Rhizosphaericola mali]QES87283.1 glutamate synthase subunit beta [Rhizosphaericola mali]
MGHKTGFIDYTREEPNYRSIEERVSDYKEFHEKYTPSNLNHQAARCMDCGVPFCTNGCPLGNVIPDFNDAVYRGAWKEAYDILSSTNNFPEFTGRICPAPCESACVLGINQPPVTIEEIEKHIIEIAFEQGFVQPRIPKTRSGKKVAVIGSGPAGLAAAAQLNYAGHTVTVYERDDEPGGLLVYGIPDFKLEKWVVKRRIDILKEEGIIFKCNANVGVNVKINDLLRENQAIILATGSTVPRELEIPGRDLKGIFPAMEFLKQQNKINLGKDPLGGKGIESNVASELISAADKKVVVIGGGDTGSDCVGTSNRQGATSIMQLTHGPKPPSDRTDYMPWPGVPAIFTTSSSQEEGVIREFGLAPLSFVGDENGNLTGLKVASLEWQISEKGKRIGSIHKIGSEKIIPCDVALLAMGFIHPQHEGLLDELGVELDLNGNVKANNKNFVTNISKIYACGDARKGQSLVVWAISEGRECARIVDEALSNGISELESKDENILIANG